MASGARFLYEEIKRSQEIVKTRKVLLGTCCLVRLLALEAWGRDLEEGIRLHGTVMLYSLVGVPAAAKERTLRSLRGLIEYVSLSCDRECELTMRKEFE